MKHVKKVLAFVMAFAMTLAFVTPAFADTIDVQNVVDGEEYTAYKILNYTAAGTGDDRIASYYLTSGEYATLGSVLEAAGFSFTASADGTQYFVNNADEAAVTLYSTDSNQLTVLDPAGAAAYLGAHESDLGDALGVFTATGEGGQAVFENMTAGYYFVSTTTGSLCALHEDGGIATMVEKNTVPTIDKKESTGTTFVDGPIDANIGQTVHYQVVITDGTGTNANITMTDTLSDGLDYTAGSLKINGSDVADDANTDNWEVTVSGRTITIVFKAAYVALLGTTGQPNAVTVTYDATINKDAVIRAAASDDAPANTNTVELDYSNQHDEDTTVVNTYDFQVYKTDGTDFIDGAEFKLYDASTGGNQIKLSHDDTGYYVDANGDATTTIVVNSENGVNVRGLTEGTYYLEEVVAPNGYNKLAARETVDITTGATAVVEVTVVNNAGSVMPSTGGIGTTIFYVVGGVMVAGAVIFLLTKRRMAGTAE